MEQKKFSVLALGITASVLWAGTIIFVGIINRFELSYGGPFVDVVASIYPGYVGGIGLRDLAIGALYGLLDGFVSGALFAWIYNCVAKCICRKSES